jgi:uncharacterized protein
MTIHKTIIITFLISCGLSLHNIAVAQEKLYPHIFPLHDVSLLESPFKHARDLNIKVLLEYDVDRLLAPYLKEAGLTPKSPGYSNWEGLDGHVGGHYLSALAMNYASVNDPLCKQRMDYMISVLRECQNAHARQHAGWGKGYVGGVPNSAKIWSSLKVGDFGAYHSAWVPWYNVHKMYSGLRDAWMYGGSEEAKQMFLHFCNWAIDVTSSLTEEQMQTMLATEHGGMNEVLADAYAMTRNEKYLIAAKRFSHKALLDPLSSHIDNLDNKHANTQVPKAVGFQRIAELSKDRQYDNAGRFFWETVTANRSLAFGGNSRREFFPAVSACLDFVNEAEGPETCNSYNMLKLTENLFRMNPSARYIDYYERTLFNHILSTQHPQRGGYVYFTPARPAHYRVYSTPNQGMWCCVGSGMENHGKYNQFIYANRNDSLFVNLFIPSELHWKSKKVRIRQETKFPFVEQVDLKVTEGSSPFTLMIRYPFWVKEGALKIMINGKPFTYTPKPSSYVAISRKWKKGDVIRIVLPMHGRIEQLPNVPHYVALLHGPILLASKTGTEDLKGLMANDGRWAHIASGKRLPVDKAPVIIEDNLPGIVDKLKPVEGKPLTFAMADVTMENAKPLVLEPFFQIHDARYMMYWMALSRNKYQSYLDSLNQVEAKKLAIQNRTIDYVAPGEQQPEADHAMDLLNSRAGSLHDGFYRDASDGGHFSYLLSTEGKTDLSLMIRYWGAEWGNRKFAIYIDDHMLVEEDNTGRWNQSGFFDVTYPIPDEILRGKKNIRVKFKALPQNTAGAVYYIRLLDKEKSETESGQ